MILFSMTPRLSTLLQSCCRFSRRKAAILLTALVLLFLLSACGNGNNDAPADASPVLENQTTDGCGEADGSLGQSPVETAGTEPVIPDLSGTYWKSVSYSDDTFNDGEYQTEVFLWQYGEGRFRFIQETPGEFGYYGYRDEMDCYWETEGIDLLLTDKTAVLNGEPYPEIIMASFTDDLMQLEYGDVMICLEQAEMPPWGAQWDVPDLFGAWRMISYEDDYGICGESDMDISAIMIFHNTLIADYSWSDPVGYGEAATFNVERLDEPLGRGYENVVWQVALTGETPDDAEYYASYCGDTLHLVKINPNTDEWQYPIAFAAVFTRLGLPEPLQEWPDDTALGVWLDPPEEITLSLAPLQHELVYEGDHMHDLLLLGTEENTFIEVWMELPNDDQSIMLRREVQLAEYRLNYGQTLMLRLDIPDDGLDLWLTIRNEHCWQIWTIPQSMESSEPIFIPQSE